MEARTLPQRSGAGGSAAAAAAAVRTDRRTHAALNDPQEKSRSGRAAGSPASAPETLPLLQPLHHDVNPSRNDSRLRRVGGKMSAQERSQLTGTWLRSIRNAKLPLLRPRCYSRQHLKVQQKSFTHLLQIYYMVELKWLNDDCCRRALDAGGGGGGSCADRNASLLPRLLSKEQGKKHRSEQVYQFNSRHFSLETPEFPPETPDEFIP